MKTRKLNKKKMVFTNTKSISIKRRIYVDDSMKKFIFDNINYRRKVWNDFVEESRKYENVFDFDPLKYRTIYYREIEVKNHVYDDYCVDISKQVSRDILFSLKMIRTKKQYDSKFQFKKFDKFKGSFKVPLRPQDVISKSYPEGRFNSRLYINDDRILSFRVRKSERIMIKLYEPLFYDTCYMNDSPYPCYYDKKEQYYFHEEDIKEIVFLHEMGKFYIVLFINVIVFGIRDITKKKLGIDLGIHNPLTCYDGSGSFVLSMSKKEINRIYYLERRAKRLQQIMDNKLSINNYKKTKNYYKVLKKFRITWKKIYNIRLNWRRKLAKKLCENYDVIVVDKFKQPTKENHVMISKSKIKRINYMNRFHGMYYFYETLIHCGIKYGCEIFQAPKNTTRTCHTCGHKNPKLELDERYLYCESCGEIIDRDVNAAINCYNSDISYLDYAVC